MLLTRVKSMIILMLFSAILSCSESNSTSGESIMPLAVGNYWIYTVETYEDNLDNSVFHTENTQRVEEEITWGGYTWYGHTRGGAGQYHRNAKEGIYLLQIDDKHPDGEACLLFEYPIKAGTSWTIGESTTTVEAIDETVTVPAGVFDNCIRCDYTMPDISSIKVKITSCTRWFKPGIGKVKIEMVSNGWRSLFLLKDYHVK